MRKRILQVIGGMHRRGAEIWLIHILRHIDRSRFQIDFLVHTKEPCAYDEEIRALGGKIIPCLDPARPWSYAPNFKKILRQEGPFDIVHCQAHHFSGYVIRLAKQAGVPVRIAHSHLDSFPVDAAAGISRRLYLRFMKYWINRDATAGLACSRMAAAALFGPNWQSDSRWRLLFCGIDLAPFKTREEPATLRAGLGIPADAYVIGHVGRFVDQKNHVFLVHVAREVANRDPRARFLLVGDGPLRPAIEKQVAQAGLADRVIFTGARPDVPRLMLGAMDIFLFPSLFEGLGLVLIEAQASGLPCIISDVVPEEADVVPGLVRRLSLSQPAAVWAEAVLAARDKAVTIPQAQALALVEESPFNILYSVRELEKIYSTLTGFEK